MYIPIIYFEPLKIPVFHNKYLFSISFALLFVGIPSFKYKEIANTKDYLEWF